MVVRRLQVGVRLVVQRPEQASSAAEHPALGRGGVSEREGRGERERERERGKEGERERERSERERERRLLSISCSRCFKFTLDTRSDQAKT